MTRQRHVVLVHPDRDAERASWALGKSDVVEVRVREDDRIHVTGCPPERTQRLVEGFPRRRDARVHHGQATAVLDEVPVGERVLDAVDPRSDVTLEHDAGYPTGSHLIPASSGHRGVQPLRTPRDTATGEEHES
jgi:hypothetical protein